MDGAKAVAVAAGTVFVKTTWLPSRFSLAMTDGADAEVRLRGE
jgi:DNA-repair protein XRCC4